MKDYWRQTRSRKIGDKKKKLKVIYLESQQIYKKILPKVEDKTWSDTEEKSLRLVEL